MFWPFASSKRHEANVEFKQQQRRQRIDALPEYSEPLTSSEQDLLAQNVEDVVRQVSAGEIEPRDVLRAYGKAAVISQRKTNCLTEIMLSDAEVWAAQAKRSGPLAGIPVSLKDPFAVVGYDTTVGFSALVNKPTTAHSPPVQLLLDAGAVPYVKTNIPITMMAIDGYNDLFGQTLNPHKLTHAPGGSSQGEGALIASGGSRIGIGTDIGGSVRIPAAWCGIYSLRFSSYRFPDYRGPRGFEGIPSVASPMAASWRDLKYFSDAVMGMKPWTYDHQLVNTAWQPDFELPKKLRIGVLNLKDYLPATPAVDRALTLAVTALQVQGHEVVDFDLPDPATEYGLILGKLFSADGYAAAAGAYLPGEHRDPSILAYRNYTWWPKPLRRLYEFVLSLFGFKEKAQRLHNMSPLSVAEYYAMISRREQLRRRMFDKWNDERLDFVISPVHPSPALVNGSGSISTSTILYTSLWNLIDYPAGVLPVTRVEKAIDALPQHSSSRLTNKAAEFVFQHYDATSMDGLPVALQVIAPRYHEEQALAAMKVVEDALHADGVYYR